MQLYSMNKATHNTNNHCAESLHAQFDNHAGKLKLKCTVHHRIYITGYPIQEDCIGAAYLIGFHYFYIRPGDCY
jgi:hypothetical protein